MIHGYAQEASIAVKTVTEAIATKHGIVLIAVIVWITRTIYAMSAINVLRIAVTVTINAKTAVKNQIPFAQAVGKNAPNVPRMKCAQTVVNAVKSAVNL